MDPETQHILTTYGPSTAAAIALLAALGRPGSVEGIVKWIGDSIHAVSGWGGRLADRVIDAYIRRLDSGTKINETLAIALQLDQLDEEPRRSGPARRSAEVRSVASAHPSVGTLEEIGKAGPDEDAND